MLPLSWPVTENEWNNDDKKYFEILFEGFEMKDLGVRVLKIRWTRQFCGDGRR